MSDSLKKGVYSMAKQIGQLVFIEEGTGIEHVLDENFEYDEKDVVKEETAISDKTKRKDSEKESIAEISSTVINNPKGKEE